MSMQVGYVGENENGEYILNAFGAYMQPIYSEFNSTTYVVYELTDYINEIKTKANIPGHEQTITIACYDYALNQATYEIPLPNTYEDVWFEQESIMLSPNEVYTIDLATHPTEAWGSLLDLNVTKPQGKEIARVVNNKILAIESGTCYVRFKDPITGEVKQLQVTVLADGDEGYRRIDKPVVDEFRLTGYYTDKAFHYVNSGDRVLGSTGDERKFSENYYALEMFPSEAVTLRYVFDPYFPDDTKIVFESSNENLVTIDENGKITAVAEGYASVSVRVMMDGKSTYYSQNISIEIKDPFVTSGPTLTNYFGAGVGNSGSVTFPEELAINAIGQFAFSNYDYVEKGPNDEISEESPDATKIWYIGNTDIKEVIIPEGIESIGPYAFANLTALTRVVLPSTLERIDYGAFYGCTSLQSIATRDENGTVVEGLINAKFINMSAFTSAALRGTITFGRAVAIADEAFGLNKSITKVILADTTQSIGSAAFYQNTSLQSIEIKAEKLKLGTYVFADCRALESISINAAVLPAHAFDGCSNLTSVTLGKDISVIGEFAFSGTKVQSFVVAEGNTTLYAQDSEPYLLNAAGDTLMLVAPGIEGVFELSNSSVTKIGYGAFSGNSGISSVKIPSVTTIEDYAFAYCGRLASVTLGTLTKLGNHAFYGTALRETPDISGLDHIGDYAFAFSRLTSVTIPDGMIIGESAFRECQRLTTVIIGDRVNIGKDAFRLDREYNYFAGNDFLPPNSYELPNGQKVYYYTYTSPLDNLTIGDQVIIGDGAFYGAAEIEKITLGPGAVIGNEAFYNACALRSIDLSKVISIGDGAFSGDVLYDFADSSFQTPALDPEGYYLYRYFTTNLKNIDLSSLESLGSSAFAYNLQLESVVLSNQLTVIKENAFNSCMSLSSINLSNITDIGPSAFYEAGLTQIDLSSATIIDEYAFVYNGKLRTVILGDEPVTIGEGAFAYCSELTAPENIKNATHIGDYAFAYCALASADLSSAVSIGEHAFAKLAVGAFEVKLGGALEYMGDNPFANCILEAFTSNVTETVNGKDYTTVTDTFDLSADIRVIDGSLYRVVPKGLELITFAGDATRVNVADNTVRVSAMAFAGTNVEYVVLPYTVASIGHKAFFGCEKLALINFNSYNAPILEEEYDINYFYSYENLPGAGDMVFETIDGGTVTFQGLAIIPYFMWNATDVPTALFYGANFVDYIGHIKSPIVMVRPVNGQHYDSFIMDQYFGLALDGGAAADQVTLAAIAAINLLPENITLADEAMVIAARAAYAKITSMEQRALVVNIQVLEAAEERIKTLKELAGETDNNGEGQPGDNNGGNANPTPDTDDKAETKFVLYLIIAAIALLVLAIVIVLIVLLAQSKKEKKRLQKKLADSKRESIKIAAKAIKLYQRKEKQKLTYIPKDRSSKE